MLDALNISLAEYRLEKAEACLKDAKMLLNNGSYMTSANRAYYTIFHCARAVLALDGEERKRHSGVIAYFQENYIRTGVFDKAYSYIIQNAFEIRQEADYEDFYIVSKDETVQQVDNAEKFLSGIKEYISCIKNNKKAP